MRLYLSSDDNNSMSGIGSKAITVFFGNNIFRVGLDIVVVLLYFL